MPRTTLDIDASVLRELKDISARKHKSMGAMASELLARSLAEEHKGVAVPDFWWPTMSGPMLVDIDDKDALWEILDKELVDLHS
jgi:hypothetical protein